MIVSFTYELQQIHITFNCHRYLAQLYIWQLCVQSHLLVYMQVLQWQSSSNREETHNHIFATPYGQWTCSLKPTCLHCFNLNLTCFLCIVPKYGRIIYIAIYIVTLVTRHHCSSYTVVFSVPIARLGFHLQMHGKMSTSGVPWEYLSIHYFHTNCYQLHCELHPRARLDISSFQSADYFCINSVTASSHTSFQLWHPILSRH